MYKDFLYNQIKKAHLSPDGIATWRRSLPLSVLPTLYSTEKVVIGDPFRDRLATISWGGSISSSPPKSPSSISSFPDPLLAFGGAIRAEWSWIFPPGIETANSGSSLGTEGIIRVEVEGEEGEAEMTAAVVVLCWGKAGLAFGVGGFLSSSGRAARIPKFHSGRCRNPARARAGLGLGLAVAGEGLVGP